MPPRSWGWWTQQKLDILGAYLGAFTRASKTASQTVYLDLFAGRPDNVSRDRDPRVIRGSARRALETQPPLTTMRFFELESRAERLKQRLAAEYPDRAGTFKVVPGDCNVTIGAVLAELDDLNWAPTFAFLDQQSTEVHWATIEALARHKRPDKWKTEIWLLFANGLHHAQPEGWHGGHRHRVRRDDEPHVRDGRLGRRPQRDEGRDAESRPVPG